MMVTQSKAIEALLSRTEKEKQTNFQRITASPEALAEFISGFSACCDCPADKLCVNYQECYKAMLEWLKQESE